MVQDEVEQRHQDVARDIALEQEQERETCWCRVQSLVSLVHHLQCVIFNLTRILQSHHIIDFASGMLLDYESLRHFSQLF